MTLKTAWFLFLFILMFPLESFSDETPQDTTQHQVSLGDELNSEQVLFDESALLSEENIQSEETLTEETLTIEETQLSEENLLDVPNGEGFLTQEMLAGMTAEMLAEMLGEEPVEEPTELSVETASQESEQDLLDDFDLFFDGPSFVFEVPAYVSRSLDEVFPNFSQRQKRMLIEDQGLRYHFTRNESPTLIPNPDLEINLLSSVMRKNPSHLIEALVVVPYNEKEFDLLDIYNALGRIEKIKDHSIPVGGNDLNIFTESTRLENARNRRAVSDPSPATSLPFSETMHLRLKEYSFGNLFLRGEISISTHGITYSMTNFTDVRYFLVPIMKAERFTTIIYLEPIEEGVLIYNITGFYLPGFIADRVNLTPNINRRIQIFINWITEGLRAQ